MSMRQPMVHGTLQSEAWGYVIANADEGRRRGFFEEAPHTAIHIEQRSVAEVAYSLLSLT